MATFLAERYWPGLKPEAARAATALLDSAAAGIGVIIVETIVAGEDEVCLWYVEAASDTAVASAFAAAGLPVDRIAPASRDVAAVATARATAATRRRSRRP